MPVRFGAAGELLPDPIRVEKTTGVVSYARGPSVEPGKLIDIERKRLQKEMRQ